MIQSAPSPEPEKTGFGRWLLSRLLLLVAAVLAIALLGSSVVFVDEAEFVIIERFGNIRDDGSGVFDRPEDRGLHFKLPWPVETVRRFDCRLQLLDSPAREVHTQKKRNIVVDSYVCWRIAESPAGSNTPAAEKPVVRFFRAVGDLQRGEARLDTRMRSILPAVIGRLTLAKLLHADTSRSGPEPGAAGLLETVSASFRQRVIQQPGEEESLTERFGMEIVDVRIKRLSLPAGNRQAVYDRMRSDRTKDANQYRADGLAQKLVIEGQARRQYEEVLARARADAERIRGEGEAQALQTLNEAYAQDREFYQVMRTLESYREILNERTTLVLSASSNLMKLLTEGVPDTTDEATPRTMPKTADVPTIGTSAAAADKPDGTGETP